MVLVPKLKLLSLDNWLLKRDLTNIILQLEASSPAVSRIKIVCLTLILKCMSNCLKVFFSFQEVSSDMILSIIQSLQNKTSSGRDGISNVLLKTIAPYIIRPIFNYYTCILIKYTASNFLAIAQIRPLTWGSLHRTAMQTEGHVDSIVTRGEGGEDLARCEYSELGIWNMSKGGISLLVL